MQDRDRSVPHVISPSSNVQVSSTLYHPSYLPDQAIQLSPMHVHFAPYPGQEVVTTYISELNSQHHLPKVSNRKYL